MKNILTAKQQSQRGGFLLCKNLEDRVEINGKTVSHLIGVIILR